MKTRFFIALAMVLSASNVFAASKWVCDAQGHDMYGNPVGPVPGFAYPKKQDAANSAVSQCQIRGGLACNVTFCWQENRPTPQ